MRTRPNARHELWMQVDAAAAKSAANLADKTAALAAADQAAAAQAAEARNQQETRWKEASDKLAALQKKLQVNIFTARGTCR